MQMRLKDGKEKVVTLSYDDGSIHDLRLIEIMNAYGIKGTFNINSSSVNSASADSVDRRNVTWDEINRYYIEAGHEVAVHGLTHPWIADLSEQEILYEVTEDRKAIEANTGTIARGMAYPFGCFNDKTVNALKTAGIVYSRTTIPTAGFSFPDDWLRLPATCHHNEPRLSELADRFLNEPIKWNRPAMFYLWGHSFEFDRNDNWEIIENFCKQVSGRDDVWYATNIEIYDYVQAYKNLQVSYDGNTVHNPSAVSVWVNTHGNTVEIQSGETVKFK